MATSLAGAALAASGAPPAPAQTTLGPDAALQNLIAGNKRFIAAGLQSCGEDLTILKQNTAEKQEPFAAILSCADSRVPVEFIFDQSIGRLFVTRVAGNIATTEMIASLEYAVAVLGVKLIMVLGHAGCGAVKAAMAGSEVPGQISALFALIQPAIIDGRGNLTDTIKDNAKFQARLLTAASPLLATRVKAGTLRVVAGYYALQSGEVSLL